MRTLRARLSAWRGRRRALARFPTIVLHPGAVIEDDCSLGPNSVLFKNVYLSGTTLGAFSYVQAGSAASNSEIGPFCSIGSGVTIGLAAHPTSQVSTSPVLYDPRQPLPLFLTDAVLFTESLPRTVVGADVWIGQGAMLKAGLHIGTGAVIGAGAIVTRDVDPYHIVGGNPARMIRPRFPAALAAQLLDSCWWEEDVVLLRKLSPMFGDPVAFLAALANVR